MDCGHGGICYACSIALWKESSLCYLCRKEINQILQVDLNGKMGEFWRVISSTQVKIEQQCEENSQNQQFVSYNSITLNPNNLESTDDAFIIKEENLTNT